MKPGCLTGGHVFAFFVLNDSEKSNVGVDGRQGGDIIESDGCANGEIKVAVFSMLFFS
jgi:hypothetical protein